MATGKSKVIRRVLTGLVVVIGVLICAGAWYVSDYYHADEYAMEVVADRDGDADGVEVRDLGRPGLAFIPTNASSGFVFYPGAKVQPEAYAPLMQECARRGILCVLLRPTFNLAILDTNLADGIKAEFPEVTRWAIGGHSMGGVAAADYLSRHESEYADIAFLASYPAADLTGFDGEALSIVGTEDQVLKLDSFEAARTKQPKTSSELDIQGGNHAYYGNYGEQAGDGTASITRDEQQAQVADALASLMKAA